MNNNQHLWKILYLILSIVIAAGVWYYVDESSGRVVTQTVSGIPIEYINEDALTDKGLMLEETENSGTSTTVDITFKGRRRHIVQLDRSKVRVTADLSGITAAGVQTVTVTPSYTDRQFNQSNTTIDKQSIYAATVNICELSHKEVELRCELTGNVAEGYSAGKVQLSQTSIAIRGQKEDIEHVSYAKVTFDIGRNARETVTALLGLPALRRGGAECGRFRHPCRSRTDSGDAAGVCHQGTEAAGGLPGSPRRKAGGYGVQPQAGEHCGFRRRLRAEQHGHHHTG